MRWQSCLFGLGLLINSLSVPAFYQWETVQTSGDARLLLRAFAVVTQQPESQSRTEDRNNEAMGGLARLIVDARQQEHWQYEFNAYQTYIEKSLVGQSGSLGTVLDVERSGALEWSVNDDEYAHFAIDRLSARWSSERVDISLGRQPINLATTFFFSPNDFFAPFSAQTFYRVYKPGVDAVRAGFSLSELSSLSLIAVQGYRQQADSDSGWSDKPESDRNSYLVHYLTNLAGFEWGILAGKVRRTDISGGSISGELFGWLGLRLEGHRLEELDGEQQIYQKYSLGIEHRWENSLYIQLEQYYHGPGATDVTGYDLSSAYPARRYLALGVSYEITPLLTAQVTVIRNQIDASRLYSVNTIYSVSNESELSLSLSIPAGEDAQGSIINSEFGLYPRLLNIEFRGYF